MMIRYNLLLLVILVMGGCSFGPNTVQRDRMGYVTAVSESLETQMLFNLAKIRYGNMPVFMDVSSIINQYTLEGFASVDSTWDRHPYNYTNAFGLTGHYADKPTITYTPLTGDKFTRSLLKPVPPSAVLNFLQSGRSPDFLLRLCVQSINGIQNQGVNTPAEPRFDRLVRLIARMQDAGGVMVKFGEGKEKDTSYLIITQSQDPNAAAERGELRDILKLNRDATEVSVVYGAAPANDTQVAMVTRSVLDIMVQVAMSADVPQKDIDEKRCYPGSNVSHDPTYKPLARIHSGKSQPKDAAISVHYRDLWFWVDDRDLESKRMFSTLLLLVNLAEAGQPNAAPLITIPAG